MLNPSEFEEYFRDRSPIPKIPAEYSTTHPEYLQSPAYERTKESLVIEALIWHTDFPYSTSQEAQKAFSSILKVLALKDTMRIRLVSLQKYSG